MTGLLPPVGMVNSPESPLYPVFVTFMKPTANAALTTFHCAEAVSEQNRLAGWDIEYRQLRKGCYRSRFAMSEVSSVLLATDSFETQAEISGQPPSDLVMLAVPIGDQPGGILGRGRALTSDRVDLIEANSECHWIVPPGTNMNQAYVPREQISAAYRQLYRDELPEDLNTLRSSVRERALISPLRRLISNGIHCPDIEVNDQKLLAQGIVELTAKIIACRLQQEGAPEPVRIIRRRYLYQKACDYIDNNLGSSVSIADLCQDLDVSISTLERAFRQTIGLPPLAYLQSRRMNRARQLLLSNDGGMTVADVALQCGLPHFGRFSQCYRSYFGELPSQTVC